MTAPDQSAAAQDNPLVRFTGCGTERPGGRRGAPPPPAGGHRDASPRRGRPTPARKGSAMTTSTAAVTAAGFDAIAARSAADWEPSWRWDDTPGVRPGQGEPAGEPDDGLVWLGRLARCVGAGGWPMTAPRGRADRTQSQRHIDYLVGVQALRVMHSCGAAGFLSSVRSEDLTTGDMIRAAQGRPVMMQLAKGLSTVKWAAWDGDGPEVLVARPEKANPLDLAWRVVWAAAVADPGAARGYLAKTAGETGARAVHARDGVGWHAAARS